ALSMEGSIADVNSALEGMTFTPTIGYNGPASISITTNDQGFTGSGGGALEDVDILQITVNVANPVVTDVSSSTANGTYGVGSSLQISVSFSQAVNVNGGTPTLLLETGTVDREAS